LSERHSWPAGLDDGNWNFTASAWISLKIRFNQEGIKMGFWERSKDLLGQGLMSTKEILEKAGEKTKDLGEKGVIKFEIAQLEKQAEKRFAQIGRHVYEVLVKEGQQTISAGTTEIKKLLNEADEIEKTIDEKEEKL
jgi:hypothetical protein